MRSTGEFIMTSGLVLKNQFTTYGVQKHVRSAFLGEKSDWFMGLCARNPDDTVTFESLLEPSAANNYERQLIPMDNTGWAKMGLVNGETYIESRPVTFTPAGGPFDKLVNRLFLTDGEQVIAISSAFPGGLISVGTPMTQRYRLYFR